MSSTGKSLIQQGIFAVESGKFYIQSGTLCKWTEEHLRSADHCLRTVSIENPW